MKKLLSLLLVLALLLPAAVCAEGNWIRQQPQNVYMTTLVDPASYPEAVLTTGYGYYRYGQDGDVQVLCFPGPAGTRACRIESDAVRYLDVTGGIQYTYMLHKKAYYEAFTEDVENEAYILRDGSDKTAAYVDPSSDRAHAMIGVPDFGRTAKLEIAIEMDDLDSGMEETAKAAILSDAILAELERVKGAMRTENRDARWSEGFYDGIEILYTQDSAYVLKVDFPVLTAEDAEAKMTVIAVNSNAVEGAYSFPSGASMRARIELDFYAYAAEQLKDGSEDSCTLTLENGSEWIAYFSYPDSDGSTGNVYAAKVIPTPAGVTGSRAEDPFYVTLKFSGDRMQWNRETLPALLQVFDEAMTVVTE